MTDVTIIDAGGFIAAHRKWFIFLGAALVFAGIMAIAFPLAGGVAVEIWVAIALLLSGAAQVINAFGARRWQGFLLNLLIGVVYLAAGVMLWLNPIKGVVTLTVLLAIAMVFDGVARSIIAFRIRPMPGWGVLLAGGLIGIVAAFLIWRQLPVSAFWAIGLLLGINLIFSGISFVMLANAARPST